MVYSNIRDTFSVMAQCMEAKLMQRNNAIKNESFDVDLGIPEWYFLSKKFLHRGEPNGYPSSYSFVKRSDSHPF